MATQYVTYIIARPRVNGWDALTVRGCTSWGRCAAAAGRRGVEGEAQGFEVNFSPYVNTFSSTVYTLARIAYFAL